MRETRRLPLKDMPAAVAEPLLLEAALRADDERVLASVQDDGSWVLWWRETIPDGEFVPFP